MMRVAVLGGKPLVLQNVAPRLRGCAIEPVPDAQRLKEQVASFQAAVFLDRNSVDVPALEHCLSNGTPVLIADAGILVEQELVKLRAAAEKFHIPLSLGNSDRHLPSRQLIRQQLDAGKLGSIGLIRLHRWEPDPVPERFPARHSVALATDLEQVLAWLGTLPDVVYATSQPDGMLVVHLGFPQGGMALLDHSSQLPAGDTYRSISVIGSTGAAYADDHQNVQLAFRGGAAQAVRTSEGEQYLAAILQGFVDALQAGRDFTAEFTAWQRVHQVLGAVRRSLELSAAVPLDSTSVNSSSGKASP